MELTIEQALQQGIAAHKEGKLKDAKRLYRAILHKQPTHPDANHNLGILEVSVNKPELALPLFKTALKANPKIEQFWLSYIDAFIKEQQFDNAKQIIEQAKTRGVDAAKLNLLEVQLSPKTQKPNFVIVSPPQELLNSLLEQYENGRVSEAERLSVSITQDFPEHEFAWKILGAVLGTTGRKSESVDAYQKAVALSPQDAAAHNNLGAALKELGRLDKAEASYTRAIAVNPDYAEAHYNLGNTLKELGRLDEAEVSYRQAIALKPGYAKAHNNLGAALKELGRLDKAEASYTRAIAVNPDYAEAHNNLGITLEELGRIEESVSSFQQAFTHRTGIRPVGDDLLAPATTSLFFELTNKCNFHCTFCPSDSQTRDIGAMDLELIKRLYEEAADKKMGSIVNLHLMGEPTLHPKLIEILKFGASKNIKTDLVTNGSTLVAKVVPKLLDSMYGTITASHMTPTQETYQFRGEVKLPWLRYISNLRLLVREYMKRLAEGGAIKNTIVIRVMATQNTASNVIVTDTPNEAYAILKEWNDFVAEVEQELGIAPFERKDHDAEDILQENRHKSISYPLQKGIKLTFWRAFTFANTRVSEDFELETCKNTTYCPHPFTDVGILWNGDVTLCCLDHDGELNVGNVKDSSIEAVIQSEAARKLRASMLGHHPLPSVCQTCQAKPIRRKDDDQ